MSLYRIFLRLEAVESLRAMRPATQRLLANFIESLATNPFREGDYSEKDESGRQIEIKLAGKYAITYWADHAVYEVKVTDIRLADRE